MQLRIAVIGAGSMGVNHLRVLTNLDEEQVNLVGIADSREPVLKHVMRRYRAPAYSDYRQMIEQTRPDLVAVVVPTNVHYEVAAFALEHGVNVLIEKPITTTTEEARMLLNLAHQRGVKIAVGHVERFNPAVVELKRRLFTNPPGQIFHLHARRIGPFPPRIRDVGVTLDLASHDIDIMRYLANSEVEHVYAQSQQRIHSTHEDLLLGILRFGNGAIGMLDVNWLTPTKVRELSVTCEKGMFVINYLTQEIYFYENDYTPTNWDALRSFAGVSEGTMTRFKVQKAEPLLLEYIDVIKSITEDTLPTVTGEDGLAVLQVVQQLCASMASQDMRVGETVQGREVQV